MTHVVIAVVAFAVVGSTLPGCGSLIATRKSLDSLTDRRGFEWQTHAADGLEFYVEPGLPAAAKPEAFAAVAVAARGGVLDYLDVGFYEPTVSIFVVASRDRMNDLIGRRTLATGFHTSNAVCVVGTGSLRGTLAHAILHVIAMNEWGVPERWINEGAAVDAPGPWRGQDVNAVCKHLRERGELPSLDDLTRRFGRLPPLASYPAAGSLVRYLREEYGLGAVRAVWEGGRRALPRVTGQDAAALETAWLAVVEASDARGVEYPAVEPP